MPAPHQAAQPLRGRDAELGTALAALRHAQSGRSALVVVRGEPGIGKSTLLARAVYQDIPPSARAALHRSVVAHLIASGHGHAAAAPHVLASAIPGDATAVRVLQRTAKEPRR